MNKHNYIGWFSTTLGELCSPDNGLQTGPFGSQLHAKDYIDDGIPVIMPKDIVDGKISKETIAQISEAKAKSLRKHRCMTGDIVFGRRGDIGRCGLITEKEEGWLCGTGCLRVRLNGKVKPDFLLHVISTPQVISWLNSNAVGQTMLNLNTTILSDLPLDLPPLQEQGEIAAILSTWNTTIEQTEKLIAAKASRKRSLMQQLLTGKKRFAEFVKDTSTHLTKFGAMPNDWAYVSIEDIAREVSAKNSNGKKLTVLSCTKHRGLVDSLKYFGKQVFSENISTYKVVKRGQFAYATNHIEEGSIGYQDLYDEALISPMYTVFETSGGVDDSFFYKLLKTELYRHIFEVNTSASVDRRGSLRWKEFSKIKVALPSLEEQCRIAAVLETCDQEIELLRKQLAALKRQKRGLMQKLLTGQIRVQTGVEV